MKNRIVTVALTSLLAASLAFAEDTKVQTASDRISLFNVPLACPAAPEIGCGPVAKPVLLELQRQPGIAEAWLKETGTVLAVVGTDSNSESRDSTIHSILEKKGVAATELKGEDRNAELKNFVSRQDWYRGDDVDSLSKREAAIIAARLVRRVQAKVKVSAESAKTLETGLAQAFIKAYNDGFAGQADKVPTFTQELLNVARTNLDEKGFAAFQEAFAKGYLPQPEDAERTKSQPAACCSIN
jgi:hypothetical protein